MTLGGVMLRGVFGAVLALSAAAPAQTQPTDLTARSPNEARPILRDAPPQNSAPADRQNIGLTFDATKVAVSLGIVLGLIVVLKWSARRIFPGQVGVRASRAVVEVLSRSPLSPRQQFLLLRVGKRLVVVADSAGGMNPICQITDPDEVAEMLGQLHTPPNPTLGRNFMTLFRRNRQAFEEKVVEGPVQDASDDPEVGMTREEIGGLMEKVRLLSRQFKR